MTTKLALLSLSAALLMTVGCGLRVDSSKEVPPPPGAAEAVAAVVQFYGLSDTPSVHWYGGAALTCIDPARPWCAGGHCWLSDNGAGCTAGEADDGIALVSDWGGGVPISQMGPPGQPVLPHELAHLRWGDADHRGHAFAAGGEVDQATALIIAMGL